MKQRVVVVVALLAALLLAVNDAWAADPPPPTPTLVPAGETVTQTLQLQEFARQSAYGVQHQTVVTYTTSGGAVWALERRFTYGEAAIVIVGMALSLVQLLCLLLQVVQRDS